MVFLKIIVFCYHKKLASFDHFLFLFLSFEIKFYFKVVLECFVV